jgi:transposase
MPVAISFILLHRQKRKQDYYSVPYHPETNAIEEFFSQLKHYIKKESPNTYEDIERVIKDIIRTKIKREHLTNYLKHSFKIYKK